MGEDGIGLNPQQLVVNFMSNHDVGRFLFFMPESWPMSEKRRLLTDHGIYAFERAHPKARARLAESLLASLETLSDAEDAQLWAEETPRRDAELDQDADLARSAADVLRNARSGLG